ncbi:FtsX-like permease family protein [Paenibacillus sp. 1011MAR3C5]|uniref:FtsX-like permease family protein n=1 Tax=Paenibacillus sp. 1011MAR3C5 TaxID=1675787 RepID=UPI000E6CD9A5|nr:ABC transporter permease [Paenibacillus sp. 1011MAR3C5]RJE88494.1 FtsX-like permease family protein [Paenibacillus sp. 1011MAR3C5]
MSGWTYVWSNVKHRGFLTVLTVLAVTVTVALFSLLLMSKDGVEQGARKGYGPFELVIGADGSESQLVLNTFYRVGAPTGNIPLQLLEEVRDSGEAEAAFGMTTGDSHNGYPIVGVDPAYFLTRYEDRSLATGKLYGGLGEVTVGAAVAKALNLKVGDTFSGAHGLVAHVDVSGGSTEGHKESTADEHHTEEDHADGAGAEHDSGHAAEGDGADVGSDGHADEEHAGAGHSEADHGNEGHGESDGHSDHHGDAHASFMYTVMGILPKLNTADDRAIFTTMDYAWAVHETDEAQREITAIMIKPGSLMGAQALKLAYDALDNVQAVYSSKAVADVLNVVDSGSQLLLIVMLICALLAASTLLLALMSSIQERKRDVGLLRLIGKSRAYILSCLIGEGVALTAAGIVSGFVVSRLAAWWLGDFMFTQTGVQLQPMQLAANEWQLAAAALLLGIAASIGPAFRVYRTDALTLFRN